MLSNDHPLHRKTEGGGGVRQQKTAGESGPNKRLKVRYARERNSHCDIIVRTAPSALNWCVQVVIDRRNDQVGDVLREEGGLL